MGYVFAACWQQVHRRASSSWVSAPPLYFTYCVEVSYFNSSVTHAHIPRPMTLSPDQYIARGFLEFWCIYRWLFISLLRLFIHTEQLARHMMAKLLCSV